MRTSVPVMHRSDAYYSTSDSRGIRWLPSPEVCRMELQLKSIKGLFLLRKYRAQQDVYLR